MLLSTKRCLFYTGKVIIVGITLYFAKLNLVSDDIFKLYDDPKQRKAISNALYESISLDMPWEKESFYTDESGEQQSKIIEYSTHILNTEDGYIEGWIYKKSTLYYKTLDEKTKTLVQQSTENTEGNRFALDLNHGFIGYNTSARFGYKEFIEAFVNLVNQGESHLEYNYFYNIALCTRGIDLNEIKKELGSIGKIKDLTIHMQPPNPSEQLLEDLQKRCDGVVKDLKDANVTEVQLFYSTNGSSGIDLASALINEKIDDLQGLYSGLTVEESTKKGYVSVKATTTTGQKYASGDSKPIKRVIDVMGSFFDTCKDTFRDLR